MIGAPVALAALLRNLRIGDSGSIKIEPAIRYARVCLQPIPGKHSGSAIKYRGEAAGISLIEMMELNLLGRFGRIRPRIIVGLVVLCGAGLALIMVHRGEIDAPSIRDAIAGNRFAPLIFIFLQIAGSLLFVPRTFLGVAAGLLFGFVWGAILAISGAVAGAAAGFAFVRWVHPIEIDLDDAPRFGPLVEKAERGGWRTVAITRLVPVPHSLVNTALALTKLGWKDYLVGSTLGMLPMTLAQVDIGAAGGQAIAGGRGWMIACLLLALGLAASFAIGRAGKRQQGFSGDR